VFFSSRRKKKNIFKILFLECYRYSIFLFRNIDRSNTGTIRFEDLVTTFSLLMHGSVEDRLSWIFDLYDLNKNGKMTRMV
jgi:Ca2+-binding EF-hand superfamily protein